MRKTQARLARPCPHMRAAIAKKARPRLAAALSLSTRARPAAVRDLTAARCERSSASNSAGSEPRSSFRPAATLWGDAGDSAGTGGGWEGQV